MLSLLSFINLWKIHESISTANTGNNTFKNQVGFADL